MKILHVSDTHGRFPSIESNCDLIIHSGDFFINSPHFVFQRQRNDEINFQENWLRSSIHNIKKWLNGKPFYFTLGNHDFISPTYMEEFLNQNNIMAKCLHDKITTFNNVNLYGFPYVIEVGNNLWNYECTTKEMEDKCLPMIKKLNSTYVDIVVAHSPMHGCLDLTKYNTRIGSEVILESIIERVHKDMRPQYYLTGHCHEDAGILYKHEMLISNAATKMHVIEV